MSSNVSTVPSPKNWEDEEFDEVPLSELTTSEIIEQRAEIYATIIQIQTQLEDNEIFPRRDETWAIRAKAKIKHLKLESSVLGAELRLRDQITHNDYMVKYQEERTRRHEATEQRIAIRKMYKDGIFVMTCKKLLTSEQMQDIWDMAQAEFAQQPCWADPEFDRIRDEICLAFANGEHNYELLAEKFFLNKNTIRRVVQDKMKV